MMTLGFSLCLSAFTIAFFSLLQIHYFFSVYNVSDLSLYNDNIISFNYNYSLKFTI